MKKKIIILFVLLLALVLTVFAGDLRKHNKKFLVYKDSGWLWLDDVHNFETCTSAIRDYAKEKGCRLFIIWEATRVASVFVTFPDDATLEIKKTDEGKDR